MKVCGLDISTKKTGVSFGEDEKILSYDLIDKSDITDVEDRINKMALALIEKLNVEKPEIVWIEDTWNARNIQTTKELTRIIGVVNGWCIMNNAEFNLIMPSRWRKLVSIEQGKKKRQELKELSIKYVKDNFNIDVNDDVADSICILDAAFVYYGGSLFE